MLRSVSGFPAIMSLDYYARAYVHMGVHVVFFRNVIFFFYSSLITKLERELCQRSSSVSRMWWWNY